MPNFIELGHLLRVFWGYYVTKLHPLTKPHPFLSDRNKTFARMCSEVPKSTPENFVKVSLQRFGKGFESAHTDRQTNGEL